MPRSILNKRLPYFRFSYLYLQSIHGHTTRLRYVYIHPEGMEEPNLYLTFKKSDETAATKNMHELMKV